MGAKSKKYTLWKANTPTTSSQTRTNKPRGSPTNGISRKRGRKIGRWWEKKCRSRGQTGRTYHSKRKSSKMKQSTSNIFNWTKNSTTLKKRSLTWKKPFRKKSNTKFSKKRKSKKGLNRKRNGKIDKEREKKESPPCKTWSPKFPNINNSTTSIKTRTPLVTTSIMFLKSWKRTKINNRLQGSTCKRVYKLWHTFRTQKGRRMLNSVKKNSIFQSSKNTKVHNGLLRQKDSDIWFGRNPHSL